MKRPSRRTILKSTLSGVAASLPPGRLVAQDGPIRIGLMLPFSGPDARAGEAISAGFDLFTRQADSKMGGYDVELVRVDDASNPVDTMFKVNGLMGRARLRAIVGSVNPDVTMLLVQAAAAQQLPLIIPGSGIDAATRARCDPWVFRSSFTNWQLGFAVGKAMGAKGVKKAGWVSWNDTTGTESAAGFADGLRADGSVLVKMATVPFPSTNFGPVIAWLARLDVEAVGVSFHGDGAARFVKDYTAAGLRAKRPLFGTGFLTEGELAALGPAGEGLPTALHYGDGLVNAANAAFRSAYKSVTREDPNVFAVQGYDAAHMLAIGLNAVRADVSEIQAFGAAIRGTMIESPRGAFTVSPSHNPVQTIWLREARKQENRVIGVAAKALADPGAGCVMPRS
jgi:branched-chain amino acid transport system substrate-binding protein